MIKTANLTGSISRNAGGLFESVRRLVQSLVQQGVGVRVFGAMDEFSAADIAAWLPVEVMAFKSSWPEAFGFSPEFLTELLAYRPDLTHTHGIWRYTSIATNNYCRAMQSPYMISPHGMLDEWAVRNSRWKKMVAHALYEHAHLQGAACLRALCESEARAFRLAGLKNPICIIPNGIDLPGSGTTGRQDDGMTGLQDRGQWPVVRGQKSEARSQKSEVRSQTSELWPLISGKKVLLYLGRIHPKKGLVNLLRAWAAVEKTENGKQKAEEWILAIAGWDQGGHEAELKQLATELGIRWTDVRELKPESRNQKPEIISAFSFQNFSVFFLGPQFGEDKAAGYANCDAFILPSFSEGLPMTILEAWAYGKPVLMTPECNLPEGFAANAALRIEPSTKGIEQGLRELFQMPSSKLQALGANGRELVARQFAWPKIAGDLNLVYEWMLGGGAKPASIYPG